MTIAVSIRPKGASVVPVGDAIVRTLPGFRKPLDVATPLCLPGAAFCPLSPDVSAQHLNGKRWNRLP
ncbi:hypothetical protein AB0J43_04130, partial [Nonomuraea fuscirosea]